MEDYQRRQMYRGSGSNLQDILARAIKYVVEGGAVAVAAYFIPRKKMNLQEIVMIALTAVAVFAILDLYAPAVGVATRQRAGFGVGAGLVCFGGIPMGHGGAMLPGVPLFLAFSPSSEMLRSRYATP